MIIYMAILRATTTRNMKSLATLGILAATCLAEILFTPGNMPGFADKQNADFQYAGGTEKLREHCRGELEVTSSSLAFSCPDGYIDIADESIVVMQYRSDISRAVRKMKLKWLFKPWRQGGKENHYFTIVYAGQGGRHAIVLDVPPQAMRPYLAEIDLRLGRRVEVQNHEKY